MKLSKLVNDFVETEETLGWKYAYKCFLEDYNNYSKFYEEDVTSELTKKDVENFVDFWKNHSLVKDFVKDVKTKKMNGGATKFMIYIKRS